jgi:hypothetical protein
VFKGLGRDSEHLKFNVEFLVALSQAICRIYNVCCYET